MYTSMKVKIREAHTLNRNVSGINNSVPAHAHQTLKAKAFHTRHFPVRTSLLPSSDSLNHFSHAIFKAQKKYQMTLTCLVQTRANTHTRFDSHSRMQICAWYAALHCSFLGHLVWKRVFLYYTILIASLN